MFDFDLNFTAQTDICGLVKKMKSKQKNFFNITKETKQLSNLIKTPPQKDECYKMLSVGGGFSSIAVIKFIAEREKINKLYVSTFRIGKLQFEVLLRLRQNSKLDKAFFITSATQKRADDKLIYKEKSYNYYNFVVTKCNENDWQIKYFDNHSKLILMQTDKNFYVVETSSNLNENPKMEQFSFENDKQLFEWYEQLFKELLK